MKRIICFLLCFLLVFNNAYIVFADTHGGSDGSFDPDDPMVKYPELFDKDGHIKPVELPGQKLFGHMILGNEIGTAVAPILSTITDFLSAFDNSDDSISIDKGGSTIHFHERFLNELNQAVQDKVHALDGYYLLEPANTFDYKKGWAMTSNETAAFDQLDKVFTLYYSSFEIEFLSSFDYLYLVNSSVNSYSLYRYDDSSKKFGQEQFRCFDFSRSSPYVTTDHKISSGLLLNDILNWFNSTVIPRSYGVPLKVFYSKSALQKYLDNDKKRTYAPQLPSTTISIPIKYINNSVSLPDITYNINTTNKTEVEIQNEYNTTLNNYLDDLNKFSDGGGGNNPTPTPDSGFTDGLTPTPTPSFGDGSDQDGDGSDGWLKKIYDQLVKLSDSVSQHFEKEETFEDKLSKYLESHDKKLDGIVDAIDKLSQGKEEGEEKGCKYDYTELSDFMTKLWNDSDQKFDKMVELLKENNEYQEKMLSTLNSIKNILKAQTVMDTFKNRSRSTANKAKEKFPTSVPWDVGLLVNAMDAEPKAPVFELPIKIERLNIDEKITVDISSGEWEKLAKACRYMLSLLFVLFMVNLTRKLFFSKGDD